MSTAQTSPMMFGLKLRYSQLSARRPGTCTAVLMPIPMHTNSSSHHQATQGIHYDFLKAGDFLTEEELDVLRWGHSAKVTVPKRFSPNGAHTDTYRKSTAIECLVRSNLLCSTCCSSNSAPAWAAGFSLPVLAGGLPVSDQSFQVASAHE